MKASHNTIVDAIKLHGETCLSIGVEEGIDKAIGIATRAICNRCEDIHDWAPVALTSYGWEHKTFRPVWWPDAPYLCHAAPIWQALKDEGLS